MFQYDLQAKPDSTFTLIERNNEILGRTIKMYHKKLDYKECDVFDELEIIPTGENSQNAVLRGKEPNNGGELCKIVMNITLALHSVFGEDDKGKGLFGPDEIRDYNIGVFRRCYMTRGKHKPFIDLYTEDDMLCMSILGIDVKK